MPTSCMSALGAVALGMAHGYHRKLIGTYLSPPSSHKRIELA